MTRSLLRGLVVVGLVAVPARAFGQASAEQPSWFAGGLGGVTFGTVTSGAVGGQAGFYIARNLFVIGEVGRMRNVLPKDIQEDIDVFTDLFEAEIGVPLRFEVSVPATYGFGGIRWMQPHGSLSPFAEAGAGVGHISLSIDKASLFGVDVSNEIEDVVGDEANATKFLFAVGGGVTARLSRQFLLDLGFRYTRIATEDPSINSGMVYVAAKFTPPPAR